MVNSPGAILGLHAFGIPACPSELVTFAKHHPIWLLDMKIDRISSLFCQKDPLNRLEKVFCTGMGPVGSRRRGSLPGNGTGFGADDRFHSREWLYLSDKEAAPIPEKYSTRRQLELFFVEMCPIISIRKAQNSVKSCEFDDSRRRFRGKIRLREFSPSGARVKNAFFRYEKPGSRASCCHFYFDNTSARERRPVSTRTRFSRRERRHAKADHITSSNIIKLMISYRSSRPNDWKRLK